MDESTFIAELRSRSAATAWIKVPETSPFSIRNLPFGIFSDSQNSRRRIGVALGDTVIDIYSALGQGVFDDLHLPDEAIRSLKEEQLNGWASQSRSHHQKFRLYLLHLLTSETYKTTLSGSLVPRRETQLHLPFKIGGYTDFFAGIHHAQTCGEIFRGSPDLQPNWKQIPVGYNGRASSVYPSGTRITRPSGVTAITASDSDHHKASGMSVKFSASVQLDVEVEIAAFVGRPTHASPVSAALAKTHIFGYVLMNDWSARDIQRYEAVPLGPFLGKSFGTTVSGWVVSPDSITLAHADVDSLVVPRDGFLPHLRDASDAFLDLDLQLSIHTGSTAHDTSRGDDREQDAQEVGTGKKEQNGEKEQEGEELTEASEFVFSKMSARNLYWSFPQMIAHHTSNTCPLETGDLIGSGTISGTTPGSEGSFLEMSRNGTREVIGTRVGEGGDGEKGRGLTRRWVVDWDEVVLRGVCAGDTGVGFGECRGIVVPSPQ